MIVSEQGRCQSLPLLKKQGVWFHPFDFCLNHFLHPDFGNRTPPTSCLLQLEIDLVAIKSDILSYSQSPFDFPVILQGNDRSLHGLARFRQSSYSMAFAHMSWEFKEPRQKSQTFLLSTKKCGIMGTTIESPSKMVGFQNGIILMENWKLEWSLNNLYFPTRQDPRLLARLLLLPTCQTSKEAISVLTDLNFSWNEFNSPHSKWPQY